VCFGRLSRASNLLGELFLEWGEESLRRKWVEFRARGGGGTHSRMVESVVHAHAQRSSLLKRTLTKVICTAKTGH
jgi:hypothetical protein